MSPRKHLWSILALVLAASPVQAYTYPELVARLTDLSLLAKLPPAGEKTALASSYDRASKYDAATDKYINWDANGDGGGIIRQEGDNCVLAEVQGPGCIYRIWSATADNGHVKIYLDGSETPAVDLPFKEYFSGKTAPFNRSHMVYTLGAPGEPPGFNNYTPISFQKSCKIVAEKGWGNYYQFTYTTFPAGTKVPTFQTQLSPEDSAALDDADKILSQCGQYPGAANPAARTESPTLTVEPGQTAVVADLDGGAGGRAITALRVKLELPADPEAQRVLLRQLTVSMTWDDDKTPAVWSPLGDFFAFVGGAKPYQSLPLGLLKDGTFYSYWYMPFANKAHIVVGNDGKMPVAMTWQVTHEPLSVPAAGLARFHAKWHRDAFLPTRADRQPDWTLLTTQGRGRYVGTHIHGWNPLGGWWGEGDDKFFVDGEKFPSSFGTGSEDYFGYAWSSSSLFSKPYHNQILNEGNAGHFDDNRWHIPDAVPFQTSFEGAIEKCFANERRTLFAAETFWYLEAGGTDPYLACPISERLGYWTVADMFRVPGVLEGEALQVTNKPLHYPGDQVMLSFGKGWSGERQLFWQQVAAGETLELALPVAQAGKYHVILRCTKAPDYGIFQPSLDGVLRGGPVDLYATKVALAEESDLGVMELTAGAHTLKIEISDKNKASQKFNFGLDYVKLVKVP